MKLEKSKYKYVYPAVRSGRVQYHAIIKRNGDYLINTAYTDERTAAKEVDLALIRAGLEPVNVLKRK